MLLDPAPASADGPVLFGPFRRFLLLDGERPVRLRSLALGT
jgi:hypothetical protein